MKLQRPGTPGSSLLDSAVELARVANAGGAVVAWATRSGVRAFFGQPEIISLLGRGRFRLVVGTDSITDQKAVAELASVMASYPSLEVRLVLNDSTSLFHPKIWWFDETTYSTLVTGSGNLTAGGLVGNWEAFETRQVTIGERTSFMSELDDWLDTLQPGLVAIDDPRVLAYISSNAGDERGPRLARTAHVAPVLGASGDYKGWLVAELNKSRKNSAGQSMFSQASFDGATFSQFFNYAGGEVPLILRSVDAAGNVGAAEGRRGRYKPASVNYYFEIGAAAGMPYPEQGRPIAIFGRASNGQYIYQLALPGTAEHQHATEWLDRNLGPASTSMRRAILSPTQFEAAWAGSPLLSVVLDS